MDFSTHLAVIEAAIAQEKVVDVPGLLAELERLKAMLWIRMLTVSGSATAHQSPDAATLLTVPQVAQRLAIPTGRAYELARQGILPTVKVGKYVRVPLAAFETWVGQQTSVEPRIDKAPRDFHTVLPRRERPARVSTSARVQPGKTRRGRDDRSVSELPSKTQVDCRAQPATRCSTAEAGSGEAEGSHDEA